MATLNPDLFLAILNVSNQDEANVLYVEDDASAGDTLELTVTNSGSAINLFSNASANANQSTYSFYLYFQPSTVLVDMDIAIAEDGKQFVSADGTGNWKSTITKNSKDGSVSIFFLRKSALILSSALKIKLQRVKPVVGNSRSSNIELHVRDNSSPSKESFCQTYLNIINHQGQRYIPIKIDVNSSQLLNDGTGNDLKINLVNTGQGPINFNNSTIEVSFDVQQTGETKSFALTTSDQIPASIKIAGTEISSNVENVNPVYKLDKYSTSLGVTDFKSNQPLLIEISALKTALPAGTANLYINYRNVPGYWDGTLIVPLQRGSLVEEGNKVGIGTTTPSTKLEVQNGGVATDSFFGFTNVTPANSTTLGVYIATPVSQSLGFFTNQKERVRIDKDGNIGIGTTTPSAKLMIGDSTTLKGTIALDQYEVKFFNSGKTHWSLFNEESSGDFKIVNTSHDSKLGPDSTTRTALTIDSLGNVGIGTSASSYLLNLMRKQNSLTTLKIGNSYGGKGVNPGKSGSQILFTGYRDYNLAHKTPWNIAAIVGKKVNGDRSDYLVNGGELQFYTQSGVNEPYTNTLHQRMVITKNGDVGIGKATPGAKLDVNGGIRSKDTFVIKDIRSGIYSNAQPSGPIGDSGWERIGGDLNTGAHGKFIYMEILRATD